MPDRPLRWRRTPSRPRDDYTGTDPARPAALCAGLSLDRRGERAALVLGARRRNNRERLRGDG